MLPLVRSALGVPAVRLHFQFLADRFSVLSPLMGRRVRSAFYSVLTELAEYPPPEVSPALCAAAVDCFTERTRSGIGKPGLHMLPFVCGLSWSPEIVGPKQPFECAVTLFHDAAATWPAWASAAEQGLEIEGIKLIFEGLEVEGEGEAAWPSGPVTHDVTPDGQESASTVADLVGPRLQDCGSVRVHLLTPTRWHETDCYEPRRPINLGDVIRGGVRRLMNFTGQERTGAERALEVNLPGALKVSQPALAGTRVGWPSTRQGRTPAKSGGLVGHFDLHPASGSQLQRELLDLLWVLQTIHLGRDTANGCGRLWVEAR